MLCHGLKSNACHRIYLGDQDIIQEWVEWICEVFNGMENTLESRSIPRISLNLYCYMTGSWKKYIRRSQWKPMVPSQLIIDAMTAFHDEAESARIWIDSRCVTTTITLAWDEKVEVLLVKTTIASKGKERAEAVEVESTWGTRLCFSGRRQWYWWWEPEMEDEGV
jgi:hypothetical protein